jgi:hypothetical protein
VTRAWWLLGCAAATFAAAEVAAHLIDDDADRRTVWDWIMDVALTATAVLTVGALANLPPV